MNAISDLGVINLSLKLHRSFSVFTWDLCAVFSLGHTDKLWFTSPTI